MFLRYTDLGVGHPATLRKLVRDCSSLESEVADMDVDSDDANTDGEGGGNKEDDDEQLESEEDSEFESEDEYDSDDMIELGLGEEEVLDDDLDDNFSF